MAVTALWRVKGYIGKVLLYAENPEKTSNPEIIQVPKELNRDILEDVIAYAGRDKATNQRQLVWGINCTAENARHEMMAVKRQFRKEKGTVAYIRQDVRTLCPKCAALYEDSGYKLKQVNPEQSYERCMICNKPKGKDYVVSQT